MSFRKTAPTFLFCCIAIILLHYSTGCLKEEYSYEGGPLPDSAITSPDPIVVAPDTTTAVDTTLIFPPCPYCKYATSLSLGQWNFRYDTLFFCGDVSNAVMTPEKGAFTFFGPSSCTPGTGLIITAYYEPTTFTGDRSGITSNQVTMQYYDNNGPKDIFNSGPETQFTITVNQFEQQSGIAIGKFSGTVVTARGKIVSIHSGNFKIQFK